MKKYTAKQRYWYDNPGCDCCPRTPMEYWEVYDENGEQVQLNGTPSREEDIYQALLELHEIEVELEYNDPL